MIDKANVWLLRHGDAAGPHKDDPHGEDITDPEDFVRPLTKLGVSQAIAAGRVMVKLGGIDECYTSPRIRALQAAVLACQAAGCDWTRDKHLERALKSYDAWDHVKDGHSTLLVAHSNTEELIKQLTGKAVTMGHGMLAKVKIRDGQGAIDKLLSTDDLKRLQ
jgi:phosphohistidine phosphatase SixA